MSDVGRVLDRLLLQQSTQQLVLFALILGRLLPVVVWRSWVVKTP